MKLTVLDLQAHPLFEKENFLVGFEDSAIEYSRLPANEKFDGSLLAHVSSDTTHLIMTAPDRIGEEELRRLQSLEYIGLAFTGFWDKLFSQQLIESRGVTVTNCPDYAQAGVAEAVFAALLAHYRKLPNLEMAKIDTDVPIGRELSHKVLGIIGLGAIGKHVADIATAFGMRVISPSKSAHINVTRVGRSELLKTSDVISIHVPKSAGEILSLSDFGELKPEVTLINTSGKEKYNLGGLTEFLNTNPDSTYLFLALPEIDHIEPLGKIPNAILYPLFTCYTEEGENMRRSTTLENLMKYVQGAPLENRVL